jgi:hypothetical protein
MAKQDQDPNDDLDTQGIPDLDAAPGPGVERVTRHFPKMKTSIPRVNRT